MRITRSAALIAALLVAWCWVPSGWAAGRAADPLDDLRKQAAKARSDLEKATRTLESRKKTLAGSQVKLRGTLGDLGKAEAELNKIRGPLAQLANTVYMQPAVGGSFSVFGEGGPEEALRSAADVNHLADGQNELIERADELQSKRRKLASAAEELQSRNAVEQTRIQQQIDGLKKRSSQLTTQLSSMLNSMNISRDRRLALACDKDLVADARKYPNGLVPTKYLCPLPQKGNELRADAALAFYKLNSAFKKHFGKDICVTDSYRSLANQQRVYYQRPGFAAIPGRSNHGLGTAVDLCGGVQTQGSAPFNWLRSNSRTYSWFHPTWAYSSPFEPWHWEYGKPD